MSIPKETVEHVAKLARLELTEAEVEQYSHDLSKIMTLVDELNQVDLSQLEEDTSPMGTSKDHPTVFREDKIISAFTREELLKNAPHEEEGFFRVPRILET